MRVLFLDFDGVLMPGPYEPIARDDFFWVPVLYRALRGHDDVRIVVHSSWRYDTGIEDLRGLLGAFLGPLVIDVTPLWMQRYEGIVGWLRECSQPVHSYRILDDAGDEFPSPHPSELILCEPGRGVDDPAVLLKLRDWLS